MQRGDGDVLEAGAEPGEDAGVEGVQGLGLGERSDARQHGDLPEAPGAVREPCAHGHILRRRDHARGDAERRGKRHIQGGCLDPHPLQRRWQGEAATWRQQGLPLVPGKLHPRLAVPAGSRAHFGGSLAGDLPVRVPLVQDPRRLASWSPGEGFLWGRSGLSGSQRPDVTSLDRCEGSFAGRPGVSRSQRPVADGLHGSGMFMIQRTSACPPQDVAAIAIPGP